MKNRIISLLLGINFALVNSAHAMDTSQEENKCAELGFTKQTEAFGNCVLKLLQRNVIPRESINEKKAEYYELEAQRLLDEARQQLDEIDRRHYLDRARKRRSAEEAEQRRQMQELQDYAHQMDRENARAMCKSWGNRYCD